MGTSELVSAFDLDHDQHRITSYLIAYFLAQETYFLRAKRGALDPRLYATYDKFTANLFALPHVADWWGRFRGFFDPEFQEFVDNLATATPDAHSDVDSVLRKPSLAAD